jgi:hypothetical protein
MKGMADIGEEHVTATLMHAAGEVRATPKQLLEAG